jgi:hypothetical protein
MVLYPRVCSTIVAATSKPKLERTGCRKSLRGLVWLDKGRANGDCVGCVDIGLEVRRASRSSSAWPV